MSDDMELIHGSGNMFRDLGHPNADLERLRAILAAAIIGVLDGRGLSVRKAGEITGIAAADFLRLRRANLGRFTAGRGGGAAGGGRGGRAGDPGGARVEPERVRGTPTPAHHPFDSERSMWLSV